MWSKRLIDYRGLLIIAAILLVLIVGFGTLEIWRATRVTASLTPAVVVHAFQNAGLGINDMQDIEYYPGPMTPGESGIEFYTPIDGQSFHVLIVSYLSNGEARQVMNEINSLNRRMKGDYACAFRRGHIVLHVYPSNRTVADKLEAILNGIEGSQLATAD